MSDAGGTTFSKDKMNQREDDDEESDEVLSDSEDEEETIAMIQRAHFAQTAAMNPRRRTAARPRALSQKRKLESIKTFHDFTKKLKQDTGIKIRGLVGNNLLELSDFSSEESESDSDGLSEEEFVVNPNAVQELTDENESYIDPETGDIVQSKPKLLEPEENFAPAPATVVPHTSEPQDNYEPPKTLSISDIINDGDLDLTKNVEIAEIEGSELCSEKSGEELDSKQEDNSQDFDITEKLKEMGEISVKAVQKIDTDGGIQGDEQDLKTEDNNDEEKKPVNPNALNVRRNIREVMDEKNLDASTLAAQRQESERLARVQEQQRIIREVQRQIALNRQNKIHQKTLSLLQGGSSLLKKSATGQKLNLPNTVLVKLPSGEVKKTLKQGQVDVTKISKPTTSTTIKPVKSDQKGEKKEVVEIVDSSSGDDTSSSSSDSDDCIMLSDSEVPPSPEADEDPSNSGLHVNDAYNIPDEQGRVQINIGHPENEEDIFVAPQIARIIKPHQIGGVRFLFDNIIESVERFSTSTGFGCILAHSMGLGKTLQIVCFCDIFLRHTSSKTVLCIMPINTLQNWVAEFNMWLPLDAASSPLAAHGEVRARNFPIYVLNDSHKTLQMRAKVVKDWTTTGGVLMIGYELFRLLSMKKDKKPRKKKKADAKQDTEKEKDKDEKKNEKSDILNDDTQGSDLTTQSKASEDSKLEKDDNDNADAKDDAKKDEKKEDTPTEEEKKLLDEMYEALVKPGPDLVICDEGHRIKNSHSNISYALKQMRTKRRVVLTGYPLQNNLLEYWCMVDFVRPNYLGSKTEFCNMFERPIQNGQCIDSTPQDIRLMRYRAHVLHSLLVGFVQRRSHAVLQSTLPQKEEYVLLVRLTPLQRKLYERFMNEVVRSTSVPNPLKAFAICCKIWNHPDVLYNFLKKRNEVNAAIEEDLDLEEIGGVTKAGRTRNSKAQPRRAAKPRGAAKKPAATIPPNTTGPISSRPDPNTFNSQGYPPNGPYGPPPQPYDPENNTGEQYPPYPNYQNQGYYPPNQGYNQNYGNNYYPQQPPYPNNYGNQYPPNNPECNQQGYNQNYWNNSNYYGGPGYYNNPPYANNQAPQEFRGNPPSGEYNSQQYPPNYNGAEQAYPGNQIQPYSNGQDGFGNQKPYQQPYQNPSTYPGYNSNAPPESYPNNQPPQSYPEQPYPPPYSANAPYSSPQGQPGPYNQFDNRPPNFTEYPNNAPPTPTENNLDQIKSEPNVPSYPDIKQEPTVTYGQNYNYNPSQASHYPPPDESNSNGTYPNYPNFPPHLETKPPLGSASSGSPLATWPITDTIKTEVDKLKAEEKAEIKSESDGEVKIEDLDTKKIVKDDNKKDMQNDNKVIKENKEGNVADEPKLVSKTKRNRKSNRKAKKSDESELENEVSSKTGEQKGKEKKRRKPGPKPKPKVKPKPKPRAKARKDRKNSKESAKEKNNEDSDSEESEKEEKVNREEELAMVKKAEEMTYDWATELLKDYIPGLIENSAKMELFFYILNESIKLGDRLLLFSQSLFTLNLIEDFLERNYIPGTNCLWQRNTNYYRLDGSTHALEREKLINEFNANPHVHLFLVSTRAGSLGINLVGANRVIVFDASWNPCHDTQAVCRVYRYGQKKPCFVYRFVMDCCLEKKIYDRQINKQGMADRVVDECNPDAVLSMKEITNLCFDNDDAESEAKDLSEHKDKYIDMLMQGVIAYHWRWLSKEPFQHESLLVDRKEKKLSSAEKRLAQRGYELEKKAASAPRPTQAYRTVRTADGSVVQRPVASVRPMQHGARWIPADVWRRQGMTAQEMTLPLDVVIPTNSAEKTNIVLKAGQRVMVLKSPKGIYMQLESGKIIAIKTSLKGLGQKPNETKDSNAIGKKILTSRPSSTNIPGSLKNNSAITITSRGGAPRPGPNRVIRPSVMGQHKVARPFVPGQRIADIRNRLGEMRSYSTMRPKLPTQGRLLRPNLPGSVSITKVGKETKKSDNENGDSSNSNRMDADSDDDTHVLDSDDEDMNMEDKSISKKYPEKKNKISDNNKNAEKAKSSNSIVKQSKTHEKDLSHTETSRKIVLTTDEKLPSEEAFERKIIPEKSSNQQISQEKHDADQTEYTQAMGNMGKKINLLKNYRHQRQGGKTPSESSLSQLEKTASSLNKEGMPDFRKNLDDITQSYSPTGDDKPVTKSKKKKTPNKQDVAPEIKTEKQTGSAPGMSHSVSNLLSASGNTQKSKSRPQNTVPVAPMGQNPGNLQPKLLNPSGIAPDALNSMGYSNLSQSLGSVNPPNMPVNMMINPVPDLKKSPLAPAIPSPANPVPINAMPPPGAAPYPNSAVSPPDATYAQYPGYGMGYGAYPNAPYYGGYGAGPYYAGGGYPGAGAAPAPGPRYPAPSPAHPAPDPYLPPNPQW